MTMSVKGTDGMRQSVQVGCGVGVLVGSVFGAICAGLIFVTGFHLNLDLKSTDFLSALLSAIGALMGLVSILLAIIALAIAVAAFFGWQALKRGTAETAANVARPAAVDAAVPQAIAAAIPAAIEKVDAYLGSLDPKIQQQVASIAARTITPELVRSIVTEAKPNSDGQEIAGDPGRASFSGEIIERAAIQEAARQEEDLEAFDAAFEAEESREADDSEDDGEDL